MFSKSEQIPRLHHLFPYESFDERTKLFFNKDTTGFVLSGYPIVGASLADQNQIARFFRQVDNLPEGVSLQFLLFTKPNVNNLMDVWRDERNAFSKEEFMQKITNQRAEFLKKMAHSSESGHLVRDYQVLISYTSPGREDNRLKQDEFVSIRQSLQSMLEVIGLPTIVLDAQMFLGEMSALLNIDLERGPKKIVWNEHASLSKQILSTSASYGVEKECVVFQKSNPEEDVCFRSFLTNTRSMGDRGAPSYWALGHMDRLIGELFSSSHKIPCSFFVHYGFFVNQSQGTSKMKGIAKRESLERSLKNNMIKWMPNLHERFEESCEVAEQFQLGERAIVSALSMGIFYERSKQRQTEQSLQLIWQDAGWEFEAPDGDHLALLMAALPMTWTLGQKSNSLFGLEGFGKKIYGYGTTLRHLSRAKDTITKEAQNMLPILGEWKGQRAPGLPLVGRRGQLFFWNPFSGSLLPDSNAQTNHNYNICIAGQTGSGKSIFMNELATSILGVGGKVFVLDFGRSFKKNCQVLNGQHIEFDVRLPVSINPFSKIPEGSSLSEIEDRDEMLATLKPLLQVMAAPKLGTTDLQDSILDRGIRAAWASMKSKSSIDEIVKHLKEDPSKEAQDLGQMLFSFTSQGSYGHFFNPPASCTFDKDFVVIETDHLRNYPELMAVVVQMLILQINQQMCSGDRKVPFLIIIDEAWKLLGGKNSGGFISESTRTARKYKGSIVLGTQHLTDYFREESPAATEAFNCSAWKCILYQENDTITALKRHNQLQYFTETSYRENILSTVRSNPPHFSEVAIFGPEIDGVIGRLCLDPFSRLLYSTNPQEYQSIDALIKEGYSIEEAVETIKEKQKNAA